MIDIKLIRTDPDLVRENIKKKFQDEKLPLVDEVIDLDKQFRAARTRCDELRSQRNSISKQIGEGNTPKQASKLGFRMSAKNIWIAHGAVLAVSLVLMIFAFSKSTGYALAAMVVASAAATLVMRAFQFCVTMISSKPSLFGKVK